MFRYKWAILWALLILALCAIPGRDLPKSDWFDLLQVDKIVHAGMFFLLFYFAARPVREKNIRAFLIILVSCSVYGVILEYMQDMFFSERSFDLFDALADGLGALLGWAFYYKFDLIVKKIVRK